MCPMLDDRKDLVPSGIVERVSSLTGPNAPSPGESCVANLPVVKRDNKR